MKIEVQITPEEDTKVIITCREETVEIKQLKEELETFFEEQEEKNACMKVYEEEMEIYLPLAKILFIETEGKVLNVHTTDKCYQVKHRLYELEEKLPGSFMRVSKSSILNVNQVHSITRNLTASSAVEFIDTYKQVFVSRNYYKPLILRLEEKRNQL